MLRSRLSYANVMATLAVFLSLGGGAYAVTVPARSVGTRQLRDRAVTNAKLADRAVTRAKIRADAVTSSRVRDRSLLARDFAAGQLPAGPRGLTGATGPQGAAGPSALSAVPSRRTIHGAAGGDFHAFDATASDFGVDVTLPIPAANALGDDSVFVNVASWQDAGGQTAPTTTDVNAGCTGTPSAPTAPPGVVCVYVSGADHAANVRGLSVLFGSGASPYGFKLAWDASALGDTFVDATWAYTAP
jgi:hypothetical protein